MRLGSSLRSGGDCPPPRRELQTSRSASSGTHVELVLERQHRPGRWRAEVIAGRLLRSGECGGNRCSGGHCRRRRIPRGSGRSRACLLRNGLIRSCRWAGNLRSLCGDARRPARPLFVQPGATIFRREPAAGSIHVMAVSDSTSSRSSFPRPEAVAGGCSTSSSGSVPPRRRRRRRGRRRSPTGPCLH